MSLGENPPAITGEHLSDYADSWEGYTEAFKFISGSDRVRLTLAADGTGTIIVGEDTPLPPVPTNPDVGPGFDDLPTPRGDGDGGISVFEGFPYSVHATEVADSRLRLGAKMSEPFRPWCELQTSYGSGSYYTCMPDLSETRSAGQDGECSYKLRGEDDWLAADCEKLMLCTDNLVCECDAGGCTVRLTEKLDDMSLRLDGALVAEGAELVGTLVVIDHGQVVGRPTVRFSRN